jgi:hypothetical protein
MRLARRVAAPAIERIVKSDAGFELFEIVGIHARQAERSREQPGASGARSKRAVSAARTMMPNRNSAGDASPHSSTITSNVQASPRWVQNTASMSKGSAPNFSATASTSADATNMKTAAGSTKRRDYGDSLLNPFLDRGRDALDHRNKAL